MSKQYQIQWSKCQTLLRHIDNKNIFDIFVDFLIFITFSLYENASFIIVSAETEYISTRSWYRNINFLRDRIRRICYSPGPVACFSDEDDVSGNQNNCYWPLHCITPVIKRLLTRYDSFSRNRDNCCRRW